MPDLLREGRTIPPFILRTADGKEFSYAGLVGKRRVVVVALGSPPGEKEREWLASARKAAGDFATRDMTVLILTPKVEEVTEGKGLPAGILALRDDGGKVAGRLGGAPALYLVGKDRGIKIASRVLLSPSDLFRAVDAMPMRRQEMRERGG